MAAKKPKTSAKAAPKKAAAASVGRPTKFDPDYVRQVEMLAKKGCTDPEMAAFFQVALSTFCLWKLKHPEFSVASKLGKAEADERVERALFERATGYQHPDVHVSNFQGEVTITPLMKHYPPDSTAMIFWLKNRRPDLWRDKPEGGDDDGPLPESVTVTVRSGRKNASP